MNEENKFEVGEVVLYQNGERNKYLFELGIVKKVVPIEVKDRLKQDGLFGEPSGETTHIEYKYFVNYHTDDTAAMTPEHTLHKIANLYAFDIKRKSCEEL